MENNEDLPEIQTKLINGVEITNLEFAKIAMIADYLILDRFQDYFTFFRLEKCFGAFFIKESPEFLVSVFKEICGPKKKYISLGRLILAFAKWKSKSSTNENFNKFMDIIFNKMTDTSIKKIGECVQGGRIFSTRNTNARKVISRFSVLTDESKNKIKGFHVQYDDIFETILSPDKTRDNITLEINFPPTGRNIRDRDGISHIGGKYSVKKGIIKFLIFKCRSGKTFYIGDQTEDEGEEIKYFLFGTSSCQLKSVRVEIVNDQLIYFEPKFQPSLRVNLKIIDFDSLNEKYINENIINSNLIFEENEIQSLPIEQLEENNSLIIPCISDEAFIEKKDLEEPISGKNFNEIYKTYLVQQTEIAEKEKEELKDKIYEKTIMRKHLLRVYLKKFKVKENISVLKTNKQPKTRISQDKFLAKIKAYRKKVDKNIEKKKEELKTEEEKKDSKNDEDEDDGYWDDEEEKDWPKDDGIEIKDETKIEDKKEEPKVELNKEISKKEEPKVNEIVISPNEGEKEQPSEPEKIVLKGKAKILKNRLNNLKKEKESLEKEKEEVNKKEEIIMKVEQKVEEPKKEEVKIEEPKKVEVTKKEEPKKEEIKKEEPKDPEPKKEEVKKDDSKNEIVMLKDKIIGEKDKIEIINKKGSDKDKKVGNQINKNQNDNENQSQPPKKGFSFCSIY